MMFRNLKANEIEVRTQSIKEKGCILLLYKDARCDQNILDETVTPLGWKREHSRDNKNCTVSVWSGEINQWVSKEDTGSESNAEAQKGLASDSFKRACFNWGIGRELYSKIFIWINLKPEEKNGNKLAYGLDFHVSKIQSNEQKNITFLEIKDNKNNVRFTWGNYVPTIKEEMNNILKSGKVPEDEVTKYIEQFKSKPELVNAETLYIKKGLAASALKDWIEANKDEPFVRVSVEIESTHERLRRSFHGLLLDWFNSGEWSCNGATIFTMEKFRNYYKYAGCNFKPIGYSIRGEEFQGLEELYKCYPKAKVENINPVVKSWVKMNKKEKSNALNVLLTEIKLSMTNDQQVLKRVAEITGDIEALNSINYHKNIKES